MSSTKKYKSLNYCVRKLSKKTFKFVRSPKQEINFRDPSEEFETTD